MTQTFSPLPPEAHTRLAQGFAHLRAGDAAAAVAIADALLADLPGHPEVLYLRSEACAAAGDSAGAILALEGAVEASPGQWVLLLKLSRLLLGQRRRVAFRELAAQAASAAGTDPEALFSVARAYLAADQPADALPLLERAVANPMGAGHPGLWQELATTQFFLGDSAAAERSIAKVLAITPMAPGALHLRSTLRRQSPGSNHVEDLRARLGRAQDPESRVALLFALAKEHEDLGENEAAFAALSDGARLRAARVGGDVSAEVGVMERIAQRHTADALAAMGDGDPGTGPLFVIGMPRSGTTLLERMLGRVPGVAAAGELLDFKLVVGEAAQAAHAAMPEGDLVDAVLRAQAGAMGAEYLRGAREAVPGSPWWLDKTPVNFLYAGLIRQCLPSAPILHLTRDPMDACFAVFKTLFGQAYPFSYRLDALAEYYIAYRRLMAHWHRQFPGRILDIPYEALVTDTETQARRVLGFCGFAWTDDVLQPERSTAPSTTASAAQVREPIHRRSVGAWRRHAAGLEPLRARLEAAGLVDHRGDPVPH